MKLLKEVWLKTNYTQTNILMLVVFQHTEQHQEDYSDLPPSQRCQKLQKKLAHLDKELNTRVCARFVSF